MTSKAEIRSIIEDNVEWAFDHGSGLTRLHGQEKAAAKIAELIPRPPSTIQDAIDAMVAEALVTKTHANTMNGLIVQLRGLLDKRDRALDMAIRAGTGSLGPRGVVDAAKAFEAYLSGQ